MKRGIYKHNKSGDEYLLIGYGTYKLPAEKDTMDGIVVDATNSTNDEIRNLYNDGTEYSVLVCVSDSLMGKKFVLYHKQDDLDIDDYFIRESDEFKEKFTFSRDY